MPIVIDKENILPVVSPLGDVVGQMRNDDSSSARHVQDHNRKVQHVLEIGDCPALWLFPRWVMWWGKCGMTIRAVRGMFKTITEWCNTC